MFYPKFIYMLLPWVYLLVGMLVISNIDDPIAFASGGLFCASGMLVLRWRYIW